MANNLRYFNLFKLKSKKFEITIINEWACPNRNPINISIITFDLLYLKRLYQDTMRLVESSGFKIGLLGIVFIFLFHHKEKSLDKRSQKIIKQLKQLKQAQTNANQNIRS